MGADVYVLSGKPKVPTQHAGFRMLFVVDSSWGRGVKTLEMGRNVSGNVSSM